MKIVVLAGGLSPERDVSLASGSLIANALKDQGHNVLLLDVYKSVSVGETGVEDLFREKTAEPFAYKVPVAEPDLSAIKAASGNGEALIGQNVIKICRSADVVFMALHGAMGENGQLQAVFDVMGIKYTGTGYTGSLLAMDKDLTKKLLRQADIQTADWLIYRDWMTEDHISRCIGMPCVVKPCSAGSSIGVSMVSNSEELNTAVAAAKKVQEDIIIKKMVKGREFSVGVLMGKALPVIEIIPAKGFYDYKNKYQSGLTTEICPAVLSERDLKRVQELAVRVHEVLRLGSYSRIDFIMEESGEFICLEANTLPGMTPTSLLPQEAAAAGISYGELCNLIVNAAI